MDWKFSFVSNRRRGNDSVGMNSYHYYNNSNQRHYPMHESRKYSYQDPTNYNFQQSHNTNFNTQTQSQIILDVENQFLNLRLRQSE
jgi:hypothetical protein